MAFPSPSGPNSYIWKLKDVYNARLGNNWPNYISSYGFFIGGESPASPATTNTIQWINIPSTGNATDFGDLLAGASSNQSSSASTTRGLNAMGYSPNDVTTTNSIQYFTFSTQGNAVDFGDTTQARTRSAGASSETRGVFCGGQDPNSNTMDYVTIASTGNAADFGDQINSVGGSANMVNSPTRGIIGGGGNPGRTNVIQYITIASTGNATDFGDLLAGNIILGGVSSNTRGVFAGGNDGPGVINVIQYITIASTGNATDFGDLTVTRAGVGGVSNSIRGVFGGGQNPVVTNTLDYITITTTGNAIDFGDMLTTTDGEYGTASGSHGGISS